MKKYKKVYVEITNRCNLSCDFCIQNRRASRNITIEEFNYILNKLKPITNYLYFHILGEPLIHPEINQLIDIASKDFNINIDFMSEVIQADSSIERLDQSLSQKLIEAQESEILRITQKTIETLKDYGCDSATFGDTFHNTSPKIAEGYMDKWEETFSRITVKINITSKMDPSKTSGKPVKQGGK